MKTKIENIKKEAVEVQQSLLNDWYGEENAAKATQMIADVNRMKYVVAKCNEILKRGDKKEKTPIEKEEEFQKTKEETEADPFTGELKNKKK